MNLRKSTGCYILSIYFVFFARSMILSRNGLSGTREISDGNVKKLAKNDVLFHLYTKRNSDDPQLLSIDSTESVEKSYFNNSVSTVFITHGSGIGAGLAPFTNIIRYVYLRGKEPVNVIAVDWKPINILRYHRPIKMVEAVGTEVARMIDFLRESAKLRLSSTTLVGHAEGAHIMGVAGKKITHGQVNQIFGLDPARRHFKNPQLKMRLSKSGARNVQVIHTNGNQLGLLEPLGHADFYPNGGSNQPACADFETSKKRICSRDQAVWIFAESLDSPVGFKALRCRPGEDPYRGQCSGKVVLMGGFSNQINATGTFYLKTSDKSPYALKLRRKKDKTYEYIKSNKN